MTTNCVSNTNIKLIPAFFEYLKHKFASQRYYVNYVLLNLYPMTFRIWYTIKLVDNPIRMLLNAIAAVVLATLLHFNCCNVREWTNKLLKIQYTDLYKCDI